MSYLIGIDQSTQGTKALLLDEKGKLLARADLPHRQMIDENGWVEHDPEEIYQNTLQVVRQVMEQEQINQSDICGIGISNQRETALCWNLDGSPVHNAIVWQCARGTALCERIQQEQPDFPELVRTRTGLRYSPYFSAAKLAWVLEHIDGAKQKAQAGEVLCGTMDSYLVYRLTNGASFKTDYSNASRTQLFNLHTLTWDETICNQFGIPRQALPEVCGSDSLFGETTLEGLFDKPIPIHGVLGDSHAALFGQGCTTPGMMKATYGTGSSIMMNIGETPVFSDQGVVTSIGWSRNGKVSYVLEGNINYTGAVLTWLKDDVQLIQTPHEADLCAEQANPADTTYLVPAFTGLGAPYWDSHAKAAICGMTRTTGKNELCRAALDSIAYQITDILDVMQVVSGISITELRVDGGPTRSDYLMQMQSDLANVTIAIPNAEELSGLGAAYAAGLGLGLYDMEALQQNLSRRYYQPTMDASMRTQKKNGWKQAISHTLSNLMKEGE